VGETERGRDAAGAIAPDLNVLSLFWRVNNFVLFGSWLVVREGGWFDIGDGDTFDEIVMQQEFFYKKYLKI